MKWPQFRSIDFYEDRLVPGYDRSFPGEYPSQEKVATRDLHARPMRSLPPTPLEKAESDRINIAAQIARKRAREDVSPEKLGLDRSKSNEIGYLGMIPDYPDRMVQRDPHADPYSFEPGANVGAGWTVPRGIIDQPAPAPATDGLLDPALMLRMFGGPR